MNKSMNILVLDVSVSGCAVGLLKTDSEHFIEQRVETDRGQAEILIPMIDDVVRQSHLIMQDITCIGVTCGPGSFTGVRIGLATARSLGLALNIPVIGLSTLDVMSRYSDGKTLFLIDTKRGDFYGQIGVGSEPRIYSVDDIENFAGEVIKDALPDLRVLADMTREQLTSQKGYHISNAPQPIYIRGAEVSETKKKSPYSINL